MTIPRKKKDFYAHLKTAGISGESYKTIKRLSEATKPLSALELCEDEELYDADGRYKANIDNVTQKIRRS